MSLRMQALLLRFLENGEIQAVGSDQAQSRVDCAGGRSDQSQLTDLVAAGQFRETSCTGCALSTCTCRLFESGLKTWRFDKLFCRAGPNRT
jgi:hypothetical protein